ncbi:MAG TPA: response regulator transcription factor [Steroidobacteraceae bacterium]|nr:response regulator transcription factor [Steroidobacteraceae bacterium]
MRIALLEDETEHAERVASLLQGAGHSIRVFSRGRALLRDLNSETYDLIMLDWEVPDVSGIDVLRALRLQPQMHTPVLFLTHRDAEQDVVQALEAGADDFLIKPPRERELLARVEAVGRRAREAQLNEEMLAVPPFWLDLRLHRIERDGVTVELTRREFEVAALLFRNLGKVLSRGHISQAVWGRGAITTTRTVDMHVSRVRKALGLSPDVGLKLTAVYGYGYRLERSGAPQA